MIICVDKSGKIVENCDAELENVTLLITPCIC